MDQDKFKENAASSGLSKEKLDFIMNFTNSKKPTDFKEMAPFLISALNSAKNKNIQFTQSETELLIQILKQNMTPEEAQKADRLIALLKTRRNGN